MKNLQGMIPPMIVPFDEKENIDEAAFKNEVGFFLSTGVDGISTGGSTGEGALLSDVELKRCLEMVMEEKTEDFPVVAGVIRNSTRDVVRAGLDAKEIGADALLITPVFYHGATDEGNYRFFREIAEKVRLPIIIYNVVPTNIITPELFLKISEIDEVIGIKQVDPLMLAELGAMNIKGVNIYSACDHMLYGTYVSGACGAISALITIAPQLCVEQWNAFKKGDQKKAMEINNRIVPIVKTYLQKPFPGKVKELIKLQGRTAGLPRKPILQPTEEEKNAMKRALKGAGLPEASKTM